MTVFVKKPIKIAFYSILFGILFLCVISCDKSEGEAAHTLPNSKQIAENFVETDFNGQYYKGRVSIKGTNNNEIVVAIGHDDPKAEIAEQLYVLQVNPKAKDVSNVKLDFEKAEILYFKYFIIVNSLTDKALTLHLEVDGEESQEVLKTIPKAFIESIDETYKGYGLAQMQGAWPLSLDFISETTDLYDAIQENQMLAYSKTGRVGRGCLAGGAGAKSCSLSGTYGCSVSCGGGAVYACCNYTNSQVSRGCTCKFE